MPGDRSRIDAVVEDVRQAILRAPFDIWGTDERPGEIEYLEMLGRSHLQTVRAVAALLPPGPSVRILEIGSLFGVVSVALRRLGYRVAATDMRDVLGCGALTQFLDREGVEWGAADFPADGLPWPDAGFDLVLACDVLEHFNFNPIPVLAEINRVTRMDGLLYVAMPNQARLGQRLRLLLGRSVRNSIDDLVLQYRSPSYRVGLHWREYTLAETATLIERAGYETVRRAYGSDREAGVRSLREGVLRLVESAVPSLKPGVAVTARKRRAPDF